MINTAAMLERLVAFKTVSRESNSDMLDFIAQTLQPHGARLRRLPGAVPGKQNLLASFGPDGPGGIVLSGHSDVVPVDGQDWRTDPFVLTARDGNLYGRGAVDMKGFIAAAIGAATRLDHSALRQPLHLAISHDEEIGCVGVRSMLATLAATQFAARGVVVGEPTGMRLGVGHKGKFAGCIRCTGQAAHSAAPDLGCNAIYLAAEMIGELRELQNWLRAHGARDAAYAVPYSTVHVGTIAGGTVLNIVPEHCQLGFELRLLPGDMPAPLLARLQAAGARIAGRQAGRQAEISVVETNQYPALQTDPAAEIIGLARAAGAGADVKTGFGTEAGLFDATLGLPSVVCGPGSIDRAHRPDEFIAQSELDECDGFLDRLLQGLR